VNTLSVDKGGLADGAYAWNVLVCDGLDNGSNCGFNSSTNYTVVVASAAAAPTVSLVQLYPTSPNTTDSLYCNATATDADSATLTLLINWYKNGVNQSDLVFEADNVANGSNVNASVLLGGNTTKNEQWLCSVRAYDGSSYSDWLNSSSVTIQNSAPTLGAVSLVDPISLNVGPDMTTVYCSATATDNDGFADVSTAIGKLFNETNGFAGSDDDNIRYSNNFCNREGGSGNAVTVNCSFVLKYFASPSGGGTWNCSLNITDASGASVDRNASANLSELIAIGASPSTINYGTGIAPGDTSGTVNLNVTNYGNVRIDLEIEGENMSSAGKTDINVSQQKYSYYDDMSVEYDVPYTGDGSFNSSYNLEKATSTTLSNMTKWFDLHVPIGWPAGTYTGTITLTAQQG
jgi:hypothetical protein